MGSHQNTLSKLGPILALALCIILLVVIFQKFTIELIVLAIVCACAYLYYSEHKKH